MRILVVTQYFYPEQFRINEICSKLIKLGNFVTVITGRPNYPEGEFFKGYEEYKKNDSYDGVEIIRANVRPRHKGAINLFFNYVSFVRQCSREICKLNKTFDLIYIYGLSPISIAIPAIKYKKRIKIPIYYYCLDIWPESVRDSIGKRRRMSKLNPIYIFSLFLSMYVYKNMDFISTKCDDFCAYLASVCKVPYSKMNVIPEYAESLYLKVSENTISNGIVDFVFLGNIGKIQNCEMIIKAAQIIKEKEFMIHFVGDGSDLGRIKKMVEELNMSDKIVFYGRVSIQETIHFYNLADVCLLTLDNQTSSGLTPPGKLYSYLASGRTILGSINGETQKIIRDADCGFCVAANDTNSFVDKMNYFIDNPSCLASFGKNSRRFFLENFTLEKYIARTTAVFDLLCQHRDYYE